MSSMPSDCERPEVSQSERPCGSEALDAPRQYSRSRIDYARVYARQDATSGRRNRGARWTVVDVLRDVSLAELQCRVWDLGAQMSIKDRDDMVATDGEPPRDGEVLCDCGVPL